MPKKIRKRNLFLVLVTGLLFCIGCGSKEAEPETETQRHAFLLENNLVFVADVPKNWRYVLYPVDDYYYYRDEGYNREKRYIEFMGVGEEYKDGEDNFFILDVQKGKRELSDYNRVSEPFVFQNGTEGEWEYRRWESEPHYGDHNLILPYYEGNVYDREEKYSIHLAMLGEEYDANEQVIKKFLESAYFRNTETNISDNQWDLKYKLDLGISEEEDILKRDLLTLHIWNKSIRMSLEVPEGVEILTVGDRCYIYLDENKSIGIYPDEYGGETLERSGDYYYCLNVEDFEETVYEIPHQHNIDTYYFPNQYLLIWMPRVEKDTEIWECAKRIVQSMRFE